MRPITWIHTADLHLDQPVTGWHGSKEKALKRREDYRETFRRIISVVKQKNASFLFIAGDFLEHGFVQAGTVHLVKECFREITDTRVFISPGNHDPYRLDSFYHPREDWPKNVYIFGNKWESLYFEEYNVTIHGRGFTDYVETEWIPPPTSTLQGKQIMVVHGTLLSTLSSSENCRYFPIHEKELVGYPFDYVALGHIHKPSLALLDNKKKTRVCYPGSPEALSWKETGERFVVYGTLTDKGVAVEWIPVHSRAYERINCDISDCESREKILQLVKDKLRSYDRKNCFQIVLQGRYPTYLELNREIFWLYEQIKELDVFHFSFINEGTPDFDLSFYSQQKGVVGLFVRKMEERMQCNPEKKAEYELALYKGLEALCSNK